MTENREINLTNAFNVRDLGGYSTTNGALVKKHRLIRGSYLSSLSFGDQQKLYNYGVRIIIDLRTPREMQKYPDHFNPSTRYIQIPILSTEMGDSVVRQLVFQNAFPNRDAGYQHMLRLYCQLIMNPEAQQAYRRFLLTLAQVGEIGGILFHCSTGKDRTGIATMIILRLLGADPAMIYQDYLLTNQLSALRINKRMNEARQINANPAYLKSIFDISTVQPAYYQFAEAVITYLYGNFDTYLHKQLGIDSNLVARLQKLFLDFGG